jgi:hypothetical protein
MVRLDLHEWSLAALVAALLAVSLTLQSLPTKHGTPSDSAVCEKPGFLATGLFLPLH